jgi:hypothetical protein
MLHAWYVLFEISGGKKHLPELGMQTLPDLCSYKFQQFKKIKK